MKSGKWMKVVALLALLVLLHTSVVGTTYCYIIASSDSATNAFVPDVSDYGSDGNTTQTGDNSDGLLWVAMLILSGGALLFLLIKRFSPPKKVETCETELEIPEGYERCVLCGRLTPIPVSMPVDWREDYEMGFGQICIFCKKAMR